MSDNLTEQAIVLTDSGEINPSQGVTLLRLFNEDGSSYDPSSFVQAEAVADISTANGSDPATTQALANALKVKINDLLAKLRTAGLLDS